MTSEDPLVSADWLKAHIDSPDVRVVDATWLVPWLDASKSAREAYNDAHIPGAVYFDIDEIADTESPLPHMLPDPVKFSARMRKLGLGDGHRIVVYDTNGLFAAARVWWMFRTMGHEDVFVLDGGLDAWQAAGGDVEDIPPVPTPRHYTARARADLVKTGAQVRRASEAANMLIVDARPADRFTGDAPEPRPELPSGHIPGSKNLPSSALCDDGCLMSGEDLRDAFTAHGIAPADVRIATCGSGVSAAIIALALARLGNINVAIYDGSWSEWAADGARPIAKGDA